VLIFNAREHIGHTDASITVSKLPSAGMVSCSLDAPLIEVKFPKTPQQPPRVPLATASRACSLTPTPGASKGAMEPPYKSRRSNHRLLSKIDSKARRWFE
jgi:hypothetical protein